MATADPVTVVNPATAVAAPKKGKKKASAPKKPRLSPSHPTYLEMIGEAIASLKERTGSSQYAITKFVEDKHRAHLPPNFKKLILVQLRKLTAGGKLTKIKNSYKLSSPAPKKPAVAVATKPKPKKSAAAAAAGKKRPAPAAKPSARAAKSSKTSAKDAPAKKVAKPKKAKAVVLAKKKKAAPSPAKVKKAARPKSVKKTPVKKSAAPAKKAKK